MNEIKVKTLINKMNNVELLIVNANDHLLFKGYSQDLLNSDLIKYLNSNVIKILEIDNNYLKLLSDYLD